MLKKSTHSQDSKTDLVFGIQKLFSHVVNYGSGPGPGPGTGPHSAPGPVLCSCSGTRMEHFNVSKSRERCSLKAAESNCKSLSMDNGHPGG